MSLLILLRTHITVTPPPVTPPALDICDDVVWTNIPATPAVAWEEDC